MKSNEDFWKAKVGHSFMTLVAAARHVLDVKPNSLKYQESYDKILYSLSIVAHEFDAMYPGGIIMEEE